jgi:Ca2+-binding RTX toxin-like protein
MTATITSYSAGSHLYIENDQWKVETTGGLIITLSNETHVKIGSTTYLLVDEFQDGGYDSVQAAVDGATGGETILVAPGDYTESSSYNTTPVGMLIDKDNITIQGVDYCGCPIVDAADVVATITSAVQSNWGTNFFVTGSGVTIRGVSLEGTANGGTEINKVVEVVGDDFTLQYSVIGGEDGLEIASAIYINDESVPTPLPANFVSQITRYLIDSNILESSFVTSNGAGYGHDPIGNMIVSDNEFVLNENSDPDYGNWGIVINGQEDGVAWRLAPVAMPVIYGNSFTEDYTLLLRALDDDEGNLPDAAYLQDFLVSNDIGMYAYLADSNGDPAVVEAIRYSSDPTNLIFVHRTIEDAIEERALDVSAGDTIVVHTGGATLQQTVDIDDLTVSADDSSDNLSILLGATVNEFTLSGTGDTSVTGNGNNNVLKGNNGNNAIDGGKGDDIITGGLGSDAIEGGQNGIGGDTAVYEKAYGAYTVSWTGSSYSITDNATGDVDIVTGVENFDFSNRKFTNVGSNDSTFITPVLPPAPTNTAPALIAANSDATVQAGSVLNLTIGDGHFADAQGTDLNYSILVNGGAAPSWISFNTATGGFTASPLTANVGVYTIVVTASDGSLTASDTLELVVTNPANPTAEITISGDSVAENSEGGTVIGQVSGTDVDGDDFVSYALTSNPDKAFKLVDGELVVSKKAHLDFETQASYVVTVTGTDNDGGTFAQTFTINLTDIREDPKGTSKDDDLIGDAFGNRMNGKGGDDLLTGGDGADTFVLGRHYGHDRVIDFDGSEGDLIDLSGARGIKSFEDLLANHIKDTIAGLKILASDGSSLFLDGVDAGDLTETMFIF